MNTGTSLTSFHRVSAVDLGTLFATFNNVGATHRVICSLDLNDVDAGWSEFARTPVPMLSHFGIDEANDIAFSVPGGGSSNQLLRLPRGATSATILTMDSARNPLGIECGHNAEFILLPSFVSSTDFANILNLDGSDFCIDSRVLNGGWVRMLHDKVRGVIILGTC